MRNAAHGSCRLASKQNTAPPHAQKQDPMNLKPALCLGLLVGACGAALAAENTSPMRRAVEAALATWPVERTETAKAAELSTLLAGVDAAWLHSADGRDFAYVKAVVDARLTPDGTLRDAPADPLGAAALGRQLLLVYGVTQEAHYAQAAKRLFDAGLPGSNADPVDRARALPFFAEYAARFRQPEVFAGIAQQFAQLEGARGHGTRMAALADTLRFIPTGDKTHSLLADELEREAAAAVHGLDRATGLWLKTWNRHSGPDPAESALRIYALAESVREGILPVADLAIARRAFASLTPRMLPNATAGAPPSSTIEETGAYLLASAAMEHADEATLGLGATVLMDGWFNHQFRPDAFGTPVLFHYKWNDDSDAGFSLVGHIFRSLGAKTAVLAETPTAANLAGAQIYFIVSPNNPSKNPQPNYMDAASADAIEAWVKAGGVLVLLENDPANADLDHMNLLADRFGLHFNSVLRKHVVGTEWAMGKVDVRGGGPIFRNAHTFYIKDVCTITPTAPAAPLVSEGGDVFMATAHAGKGTVFAAVDPWLYNEYTDGRKLPPAYDNFAGAEELARWLLQQVPHAKSAQSSRRR